MKDKINAEMQKLRLEREKLDNAAETQKYIEEKVAEFRNNLINEINEQKVEKLKEIDFKFSCLETWLKEIIAAEEIAQENAGIAEETTDNTEQQDANVLNN